MLFSEDKKCKWRIFMWDSLKIELRSILHVRDYLTRNERIVPYITENDKTPSWDGYIFVYKSESKDKSNIEGKFDVQIKGEYKEDLSSNTISKSFERSDLQNYLKSKGAIVFVVYMKNYEECKIYYNALLPFDLTKIIDGMGSQKTTIIKFREFPKDNAVEIINIFLNFIKHQNLQGGTVDRKILSLVDIGKIGMENYGLQFGYTGIGFNKYIDIINYSLKHPTYVYLKTKNLDVSIPVDKILPESIISEIPCKIMIDGEVIYESYKVSYKIGSQITYIGNSFEFNLTEGKFNYNLKGTLSERIKDVKFFIALFIEGRIEAGGELIPKLLIEGFKEKEELKEKLVIENNLLNALMEIKKALDTLEIIQDLEMDNLPEKDLLNLHSLIRAVLFNEPVPLSLNMDLGIGDLVISNLTIKIFFRKVDEGKFEIVNFFGGHNYNCKLNYQGKEFESSIFIKLTDMDFLTISNINLSKIYESIINTPISEVHDGEVILLMLEILKAYDKQVKKEVNLLKLAQDISEWLCENSTIDSSILLLNKYQIIKRIRELNSNELIEISNIKNSSSNEDIVIGACILLESFVEAQLYYEKLPEERKNLFYSFPIMKLWKNK
jgi:RNA polymerase subunit RPABC4/transcription elongation factor Spt4